MEPNWALFVATVALVLVTAVMAWATCRYADVTQKQLAYSRQADAARALEDLLRDYGRPEMQRAVASLWLLHDEPSDGDFLTSAWNLHNSAMTYLKTLSRRKPEPTNSRTGVPAEDWGLAGLEFEQHRRLVREFYHRLKALTTPPLSIIDANLTDQYWKAEDRTIIDDVVVPIENHLRTQRGSASASQ